MTSSLSDIEHAIAAQADACITHVISHGPQA